MLNKCQLFIYLKVTILRKRDSLLRKCNVYTQNFNFLSLKKSSPPGQFLRTSQISLNFQISVCSFSIILILKGIMIFQSKRIFAYLFLKKILEIKIPYTLLERWTLCFSSYEKHTLKNHVELSSQKTKSEFL